MADSATPASFARGRRAGAALPFAALLCLAACTVPVDAVARREQKHVRGSSRGAKIRADLPTEFIDSYLNVWSNKGSSSAHTAIVLDGLLQRQANLTAGISTARHQVVIAKYDEDVTWLRQLPSNLDVLVYQSNDSTAPHFIENVGNEASKYLSYIVDHYDALPDTVVFMQAGRMDWHDPVEKDLTMQRWDWDTAASRGGIAFLPTAAPCLIEDSATPPSATVDAELDGKLSEERSKRRRLVPMEEGCPDVVEHSPPQMETVRSVWPEIFESELGSLPAHWFTHCCAQFQVTRDAIQQHPLEFYRRVLRWTMDHDRSLLQGPDMDSHPQAQEQIKRNHDEFGGRRDAGHVLEVLWALLFSTPASRAVLP